MKYIQIGWPSRFTQQSVPALPCLGPCLLQAVCKLLADCRQQLRGAAAVLPGWYLYAARDGEEEEVPAGQRFLVCAGPEDQGRQGAALKTSVELERSLDERIQRAALEVMRLLGRAACCGWGDEHRMAGCLTSQPARALRLAVGLW